LAKRLKGESWLFAPVLTRGRVCQLTLANKLGKLKGKFNRFGEVRMLCHGLQLCVIWFPNFPVAVVPDVADAVRESFGAHSPLAVA